GAATGIVGGGVVRPGGGSVVRPGGGSVPAGADADRASGGIVVPRAGCAVVIRTCGGGGIVGSGWVDVDCGARARGNGATSPAPRIGGTVEVMRGGWTLLEAGVLNRSPAGSEG